MAVLHGACACLMLMMAAVANGQKPGDLNPVSHLDKAWQGRSAWLMQLVCRRRLPVLLGTGRPWASQTQTAVSGYAAVST